MSQCLRRFGGVMLSVGLIASFAATSTARQQPGTTDPAAPDINTLGPQVGAKIPDFTLSDQYGQTRTLASLMGPKGLVLVFNRSAEW